MLIAPERPSDARAIRAVTAEAFRHAPHSAPSVDPSGEPGEATLIEWLRKDEGWITGLSLVALDDEGRIVGHVVCTRGRVGERAALGLGPLSVLPALQRGGVGSALMHAVVAAADAMDEPLIALLGDPTFYARFGFRPARTLDVEAPDPAWGDYFQALPLAAYDPSLRGRFAYAAPFSRL